MKYLLAASGAGERASGADHRAELIGIVAPDVVVSVESNGRKPVGRRGAKGRILVGVSDSGQVATVGRLILPDRNGRAVRRGAGSVDAVAGMIPSVEAGETGIRISVGIDDLGRRGNRQR